MDQLIETIMYRIKFYDEKPDVPITQGDISKLLSDIIESIGYEDNEIKGFKSSKKKKGKKK